MVADDSIGSTTAQAVGVDRSTVERAAEVADRDPGAVVDALEIPHAELTGRHSSLETERASVTVEAVRVTIEDAPASFGEGFTVMCEWFNEVGYAADTEASEEQFGFQFTTLEAYLRGHGWADKEGVASVPGCVEAMQ